MFGRIRIPVAGLLVVACSSLRRDVLVLAVWWAMFAENSWITSLGIWDRTPSYGLLATSMLLELLSFSFPLCVNKSHPNDCDI